ncbi:MAG: type II toxin-antitoxin system HicA family toxin [Pirellulaceae bacterium]|nr:type II toxin-antitoxin system HicA family toxin [Pirellulaceae bacterium]
MSPLPVVSGRRVVAAFGKLGYVLDRQRGSHLIWRQTGRFPSSASRRYIPV